MKLNFSGCWPYLCFSIMMSYAGKCPLHTHRNTRKWVIINKRNGGKMILSLNSTSRISEGPLPRVTLLHSVSQGLLPVSGCLVMPGRYQCSHPSSVPWLCLWAHSHHTEVSEFLSLTQGHDTFFCCCIFFKDPHLGRFHTVLFLQYPSMFNLCM